MPIIQWSDEYKTGHSIVDSQHKELFEMVNKLHDSIITGQGKQHTEPVLNALAQYVVKHFAAEESLMKSVNYPDYINHKRIHDSLNKEAKEVIEGYRSGKIVLSITLSRFLGDWIKTHIKIQDKKMIDFVNSSKK